MNSDTPHGKAEVPSTNMDAKKLFTNSFHDVYEAERSYLERRRAKYNIPKDNLDSNLWGISFSGGGIRSATFALGVMQTLMRKNVWFSEGVFKRFDYMSSVSGGGYTATCLSTLLTPHRKIPYQNGLPPTQQVVTVESSSSPFVGLEENLPDEDANTPQLKNSVRHQLHHLRAHGNYLADRKSLFSFSLLRFVGTAVYGSVFTTILVGLLYLSVITVLHFMLLTFSGIDATDLSNKPSPTASQTKGIKIAKNHSPDELVPDAVAHFGSDLSFDPLNNVVMNLGYSPVPTSDVVTYSSFSQLLSDYYRSGLQIPVYNILAPLNQDYVCSVLLTVAIVGFGWVLAWIWVADGFAHHIMRRNKYSPDCNTPAGETIDVGTHRLLSRAYVSISTTFALVAAVLITKSSLGPADKLAGLLVPGAFSAGSIIGALFGITLKESHTPLLFRVTRSVYATVKGATVYGGLASIVIPILLVFGFSISHFTVGAVAGGITYLIGFVAFQQGATKVNTIKLPKNIVLRYYRAILNGILFVLLIMLLSPATKFLLGTYALLGTPTVYIHPSVITFCILVALLVFLSRFFDLNRISPFAFYQDRLTESYLQTNARVQRSDCNQPRQGRPLKQVRDNESTLLCNLGDQEFPTSPYHIINAALNLHGSDELIRNAYKSDHFMFTSKYVGSRTTGYVATRDFMLDKKGQSRLRVAQAMTISGAAASSAMGMYSFVAQSFLMFMFNIRLGQWLPNPWAYSKVPSKRIHQSPHFWLPYIFKEILGRARADSDYINLSDGGHTGDNLGLMALLHRRCKLIVIVASEDDAKNQFNSLNQAIRIAKIEENITIDIDLSALHVEPDAGSPFDSETCVAVGTIRYPSTDRRFPDCKPRSDEDGVLLYLKAGLCALTAANDGEHLDLIAKNFLTSQANDMHTEPKSFWTIPADVIGYKRVNPEFPNQTTGDQFFDTNQFEAYRALGEYCAKGLLPLLRLCTFEC